MKNKNHVTKWSGERSMSRVGIKVIVTSGRTLNQGRAMEKGKNSQQYIDAVAICEIDAISMNSIGVQDGDIIRVESLLGETVVKVKTGKDMEPGIAFIPCGPYFNELIGSDTQQTGMPSYKSIDAIVIPAPGSKIRDIDDFVEVHKSE